MTMQAKFGGAMTGGVVEDFLVGREF